MILLRLPLFLKQEHSLALDCYGQLAFLYPMLIVIQEMCARIGLITGGGLASCYPEEIPPKDYCLSDCSSLNCCKYSNHWSRHWCHFSVRKSYIASNSNGFCYCFFCSICNCCLRILIPYKTYAKVLKYIGIILLAYAITAIIVGGNWNQILIASIVPHLEFSSSYVALLVAIFGASLSPYLYFWQASEED